MNTFEQWANAYNARNRPGANHEVLGPIEHGLWAEHMVSQNPLWALSLLGAIPGYSAGKAVGLLNARSPASLDEMAEGYRGLGRGLLSWF